MYAEIIISSASKEIDHVFYYSIPAGLRLCVGMRVLVPFGAANKRCEGYVVGLSDTAPIDIKRFKPVLSALDEYPIFSERMYGLALYMKERYFTTLSQCLACIVPYGIKMRGGLRKTKKRYALKSGAVLLGLTPAQKRAADYISLREFIYAHEIKNIPDVSAPAVKNLVNKGIIEETFETARRKPYAQYKKSLDAPPPLTRAQQNVFDFISAKIDRGDTKPTLIQGVTGSGKTEVYLRLIDKVIQQGKSAIALVPEISLTPQTIEVYAKRFGENVRVTHSKLSPGERFDVWEMAKLDEISIIAGPRSAVFSPFSNLGIIIIDEEHEHSYKSDLSPKYHAKEISLYLCREGKAHLVMGSATPSLESYYEAQTGDYDLVTLDTRINRRMPDVFTIDMRDELLSGNMSIFGRDLLNALKEAVSNKRQAILFLNRRGYSTFVSCRKCGYVCACDECSVNLTFHKPSYSLICHYCGKRVIVPENCPQCGSRYIKYFGIGTQKVEEEVKKFLPGAVTLRMDADTTSIKHGHEIILDAFKNGEADILIGTQMIAKGLDYPLVTVVGIICADTSINAGDFRSAEITFRLLTQAAGRAGRSSFGGRVFIQSYYPEHYSIAYAREHNYKDFYEHELAVRRTLNYPPFTKIFTVLLTSSDEKKIIQLLHALLDIMKRYDKNKLFETIGPAPAFVSKVKNNYRWRLTIKSKDEDKLRLFCVFCIEKLKKIRDMNDVTVSLTPNPVNEA